GDFPPRRGFRPSLACNRQEGTEVAMTSVFEREAIEDLLVRADQRKRIEDANRARRSAQQLTEKSLSQPAVDAGAHLDADDGRHGRRATQSPGEVDLPESALADQPFAPVHQPGFRV